MTLKGLRLVLETPLEAAIGRPVGEERLDGDIPPEDGVGRLPDLTHATGGDAIIEPVTSAEQLSGVRHGCPSTQESSRLPVAVQARPGP